MAASAQQRVEPSAGASEFSGLSRSLSLVVLVLQFTAYFSIAVGLQYASRAYLDDFSGYNDEPSHYVTALMARDYFAAGFPRGAMHFAEDFYVHYTKMALGHWPPVAYAMFGVWMLLFGASRTPTLVMLAFLTAGTALLLFLAARRVVSQMASHIVAAVFLLLPIVQMHNAMVMLEAPLTLFCFAAVLALVGVLNRNTWRSAAWFGLVAGVAIMTKGNAWALALVPAVALLLIRSPLRVLQPKMLFSGAIVAVISVPFTLWSMRMVKDGWNKESFGWQYTGSAILPSTWYLVEMIGPALAVCAALGIWGKVIVPLRKGRIGSFWAVMIAYIVSAWVFHVIVPTTVEPRKLFMVLPALLLFAGAGIDWIANTLPATISPVRRNLLAAGAAALGFAVFTFQVPHDYCPGFVRVADFLLAKPELKDVGFFISSNTDGEGRFIAEIASREVVPQHILIRSSKALVKTNWMLTEYDLRVKTPEEVNQLLNQMSVGIVVLHNEPRRGSHEHHRLMVAAMAGNSAWQKIYSDRLECTRHTRDEEISIYSYRPDPFRKLTRLQVDLENKIGRTISH